MSKRPQMLGEPSPTDKQLREFTYVDPVWQSWDVRLMVRNGMEAIGGGFRAAPETAVASRHAQTFLHEAAIAVEPKPFVRKPACASSALVRLDELDEAMIEVVRILRVTLDASARAREQLLLDDASAAVDFASFRELNEALAVLWRAEKKARGETAAQARDQGSSIGRISQAFGVSPRMVRNLIAAARPAT